jgi:hypothetical protein
MNQNIWGPHLWFSLHSISFNYPLKPTIEDKHNYKNFFLNLQEVIPCSVCKKNYKRHLNEHPIQDYLDNRKSLVYWLIDMHNMVNVEIGKKLFSYDIVIKKYEDVYQKKIILNNETENQNIEGENIQSKNTKYVQIIYSVFTILIILLIINIFHLYSQI